MPQKTELFDRIARQFDFTTVEEANRNPRFRLQELERVYDALNKRGVVSAVERETWNRTDYRREIADALSEPDSAGRPVTKDVLSKLVGVLCVEGDTAPDGGVLTTTNAAKAGTLEPRPTEQDLERAREHDYIFPWFDEADLVCVSKRQNSTRYHSRWKVTADGYLRPACNGYRPSPDRNYRLVGETSISRTKEKCHYCRNEEVRL